MLRKVVSAVVVMGLCLSVALADEIRGAIFKVEGNKVTFAKMKKGEKVGEEMTLPLAADAKIVKGKFNKDTKQFEETGKLDEGIKHKMFSSIDSSKGVPATIVTDSDNKKITEIRITGGGKKKKDQ